MRWWFFARRYDLDVETAFAKRLRTVWAHLMNVAWLDGEADWTKGRDFVLWDGTRIKVLDVRAPHLLRFHWIPAVGERTTVELTLSMLPNGKTQARIHHEGLTSGEQRDKFQIRWEKSMESVRKTL